MECGFFGKNFQACQQTILGNIIDEHVYRNPRFMSMIPFMIQFCTETLGRGNLFTCANERYSGILDTNFRHHSDAVAAIDSIVNAIMERDPKYHENVKELYTAWMEQVVTSNHDIDVFALVIDFGFLHRKTKSFERKFHLLLKIVSELCVALRFHHLKLFQQLAKESFQDLFEDVWRENQSFDSLSINFDEEDDEQVGFFQMLNQLFPKLFQE